MRKALTLGAALVLAGCATIIHGSKQEVAFSSQPSAAAVSIDNVAMGQTPVTLRLDRGHVHTVRLTLAGYQPFEMNLTHHVSGWVWGNIIFGGLIGLAVDAGTGGLYELSPEQVTAQLQSQKVSAVSRTNSLVILLVPSADPAWEHIGALTR